MVSFDFLIDGCLRVRLRLKCPLWSRCRTRSRRRCRSRCRWCRGGNGGARRELGGSVGTGRRGGDCLADRGGDGAGEEHVGAPAGGGRDVLAAEESRPFTAAGGVAGRTEEKLDVILG